MNNDNLIQEHIIQEYQIHNAKTGKGFTAFIDR